MRMLFDYYETDRMMICLDPSNIELFRDFYADRSETRLLEIECQYSDTYLEGHAKRVGLAGEQTGPEALERLLPTIRGDIEYERDQIRDATFEHMYRLRERLEPSENVEPLAEFLSIDPAQAREIAENAHLFAD